MKEMKEIIKKAKELIEKEKPGAVRPLLEIADQAGQKIAEKLDANRDIILLGTMFMDLKRNQAIRENKLQEHAKMSLEAAKEFLKQFSLDEGTQEKIYNCIEAHHGDVSYKCIEAEIVANADCYKFLHPKGMLQFIGILTERGNDFRKVLGEAEKKLEEKHNILSLDICKQELEPYYKMFKELFAKARE